MSTDRLTFDEYDGGIVGVDGEGGGDAIVRTADGRSFYLSAGDVAAINGAFARAVSRRPPERPQPDPTWPDQELRDALPGMFPPPTG